MVLNDSGQPWTFGARVIDLTGDDTQRDGGAVWPWTTQLTLTLRMGDPRIYAVLDTNPSCTGTDGETIDVSVGGGTDTDPTFTVVVGTEDIVYIENGSMPVVLDTLVSGAATLILNNLPVDTYSVDFGNRTVLNSENVDVTEYIDPTSDWWDETIPGLMPGGNLLKVSSAGGGHVTSWTCTWIPAWE